MSEQPIVRRRVVKEKSGISDSRVNSAKTQSQYQPY